MKQSRQSHTDKKVLTLIIIVLTIFVNMPQFCFAEELNQAKPLSMSVEDLAPRVSFVPPAEISSLEELLDWHKSGNTMAMLTEDITITGQIELTESQVSKDLFTGSNKIVIGQDSALMLCDSNLTLSGAGELIRIKSGGRLHATQGRAGMVAAGKPVFVVETGSTYLQGEAFKLEGTVQYGDEFVVLPAEGKVITGTYDNGNAYITVMKGDHPDSSVYPQTVPMICDYGEVVDVPVHWDIDSVNYSCAGNYGITGTFKDEVLKELGLSNPKGYTVPLNVVVQEAGAIGRPEYEVLSVGSKGLMSITIHFPVLPQDAEVYLYQSTDGFHWVPVTVEMAGGGRWDTTGNHNPNNFRLGMQDRGGSSFMVYKVNTGFQNIWLQTEIVGSMYAGHSQSLYIEMPLGLIPGDSWHNEDPSDKGDSGGNRGGGGQGESDREQQMDRENAEQPQNQWTLNTQPQLGDLLEWRQSLFFGKQMMNLFQDLENQINQSKLGTSDSLAASIPVVEANNGVLSQMGLVTQEQSYQTHSDGSGERQLSRHGQQLLKDVDIAPQLAREEASVLWEADELGPKSGALESEQQEKQNKIQLPGFVAAAGATSALILITTAIYRRKISVFKRK